MSIGICFNDDGVPWGVRKEPDEKVFFGDYDLRGNPRMEEPHGRVSIPMDRHTRCMMNPIDNSMDLMFNGLSGINDLIGRLTILRDEMIQLKGE